jgi:hypothetical protein
VATDRCRVSATKAGQTGRMVTLGGLRGASLAIQPYMRVARGGGAAGLPLAASGNAGPTAGITPAHAIAHYTKRELGS